MRSSRLVLTMALIAALWVVSVPQPLEAASAAQQTLGVPAWVASMGGTLQDDGFGLAVDGAGNAIVVGSFRGSADFDPGPGTRILTSQGDADAFVVKLNAGGDLLWAVSVRSLEDVVARDVAVDAAGGIYVVGSFEGQADFDPGPGVRGIDSNGSSDIFALRLDANGNLVQVVTLGSDESDDGQAIFVDGRGQIYITGNFEEIMEIDTGDGGTVLLESEGEDDVFIIRYASLGDLLRAWALQGDADDLGLDIVVDGAGNVYVAGEFEDEIDFDPDLDDMKRSAGDEDVFVAKYNDGADLVWSATFGGLEEDERPSLSIDGLGNVYVTGNFEATADFDPGEGRYELTSRGEEDIFLVKLSRGGNLVWAHAIGGLGSDRGEGIVTGRNGDLFVTGSFRASVDFDPGSGQTILSSAGDEDIFVARYGLTGFLFGAQAMSGSLEEMGHAIALDVANGLYVAGSYQGSVNFNAGGAAQVRTSAGNSDVFVVKRTYEQNPFGEVAGYFPIVGAEASFVSAPK